jgi:hypothetical protein
MNILRKNLTKAGNPLILKIWLGGLDSNQDSQIQSLESYQLDDLPAEGELLGSSSGKERFATALQPFQGKTGSNWRQPKRDWLRNIPTNPQYPLGAE